MTIEKYKGYIFDVDGTLYHQRLVRFQMAIRLLCYYLPRPRMLKELVALYEFRRFREKNEFYTTSMDELYSIIGLKLGLCAERVGQVIDRWMFHEPLDLLSKHKYEDVLEFARRRKREGAKIVIYSDYPALEKLSVMKMPYDMLYVSGEDGLKPSSKAMHRIIFESGLLREDILYIGDRYEKDGLSAKLGGVAYLDIAAFRRQIV